MLDEDHHTVAAIMVIGDVKLTSPKIVSNISLPERTVLTAKNIIATARATTLAFVGQVCGGIIDQPKTIPARVAGWH